MAGIADLLLRHGKAHEHHVALGLGEVAYITRSRHHGVNRLASEFGRVTGRTIGSAGHDAGMLDRHCRECGSEQKGCGENAVSEAHGDRSF